MLVNKIKYDGSGLYIGITIITFENIHLNYKKHAQLGIFSVRL
jgi:hypothetical protein